MELLVPAIIFCLLAIGLLIFFIRIPVSNQSKYRWVVATFIFYIAIALSFVIPNNWQLAGFITRTLISSVLAILGTFVYGGAILHFIARQPLVPQRQQAWTAINTFWLIAYIIFVIISATSGEAVDNRVIMLAPFIVSIGGIGLASSLLIGILFLDYYRAPLPELANRSGFWVFNTLFYVLGSALILSNLPIVIVPGLLLLLIALIGIIYGYRNTHLFDVRTGLGMMARNLIILTLLSGGLILGGYVTDKLNLNTDLVGTFVLIGFSLIIASLFLPLIQAVFDFFKKLLATAETDLPLAITEYSRQVSLSTNLEDVVIATTLTLNQVLNIRRSGLILINNTFRRENAVEFVVMSGVPITNNELPSSYISKDNPIYQSFSIDRIALTQFDMDFDPKYHSVSDEERRFFQSLYMRAYAPIVTENNLIGIIACGPKLNDTPYTTNELELLIVIGQQVGTALRSARLIDDLRHLNTSMRSLNSQLQVAKQDLEKLDTIKTDFVTIASHELRTPLAQVRGYGDIIDSLNEQEMLDKKQTGNLVNNLRRATERMEELISAMLDVSQLDVNSMDLRFMRTKPDTIIKLALEPLTDAIQQRKQTIEVKNLGDLPPLQADMQRIVQAFRNIIVNAVKFTPDDGRIEISASVKQQADGSDHVLFAIKDTGVGIHAHDKELIFKKFYRGFDPQLHSTGTYKFMGAGPGLGTTIAKGIIEGHGGRIWVESPGHHMEKLPGATFYISMPLNPPEDARRVMPFEEPIIEEKKTAELPPVVPEAEFSQITRQSPVISPAMENKKPTEG